LLSLRRQNNRNIDTQLAAGNNSRLTYAILEGIRGRLEIHGNHRLDNFLDFKTLASEIP
jgi:hypothetical protein